jgi:hypothetical protein
MLFAQIPDYVGIVKATAPFFIVFAIVVVLGVIATDNWPEKPPKRKP